MNTVIEEQEEQVSISWSITRNILIPYLNQSGETIYDANPAGRYFQIVGDAIKTKSGIKFSPTLGYNSFLGRLCFESRIFTLSQLNESFLEEQLNKIHKTINDHPEYFEPIAKFPAKLIKIE